MLLARSLIGRADLLVHSCATKVWRLWGTQCGAFNIRKDVGQAAAEFAIVAVAFVTLIFGAIEVGRLLFAQALVVQAAGGGGRMASVLCSRSRTCWNEASASKASVVRDALVPALSSLGSTKLTCQMFKRDPVTLSETLLAAGCSNNSGITYSATSLVAGDYVHVRVSYEFSPVIALVKVLFPYDPYIVSGNSYLRVE